MRIDEVRLQLVEWAERVQLIQRIDLYGPWSQGRPAAGVSGLAIGFGARRLDAASPELDPEPALLARWQHQIQTLLQRSIELTFYFHGRRAEVAALLRQSNITLYERSERSFELVRTDHPIVRGTAGN